MATPLISRDSVEPGVRLSTLSPKYLHTNSTSHTWPFSAIAELIDNAYDPDVNASQLWIDIKRYNKHNYCLVFTDNGAGMGPEKLHKMLSFGFCDKVPKKGHMPVGHYGNGFKSGSMRLGKDAIVLTKDGSSRSVGFLSQTYLEAIKAETILVPMVTWDCDGKIIQKSDGDKALEDILTHSIFRFKEELLAEFAGIQNPCGTRIIIFNVRTSPDGKPEFDYSIPDDIRIPEDTDLEITKLRKQERQNHIPESDYSLRAYCAILYLRPRMQIIIRGKKVRTTVITKSLSKTEVDHYRPTFREINSNVLNFGGQNKPVKITFGFSQNKNHYGIMMYHRNRLVKPYVRVGYQLRANNLGVGVVGVIECDFLQPTHNKQDFDYTKAYRACMSALGSKLNDYWNEKKGPQRANSREPIPEPVEVQQLPDQVWAQCDNPECLKWRKLPDGTDPSRLPDKWYCKDHPDPNFRSCDVPEEKEEEIEQPYIKTQKKRLEKEMEDRKRREKEAQLKQAEEAKRLEQQRKDLEKREEELQRLRKRLNQAKSDSTVLRSIEENSSRQQQVFRQQLKGEQKSPQPLRVKLVTSPSSAPKHSSSFASPVARVVTSSQTSPGILTLSKHQGQKPSVEVGKTFSSSPSSQSQAGTKPLVHIVPSLQGTYQQKGATIPKVVAVQSMQQGQTLHVNLPRPMQSFQVKQSPVTQAVQIQKLVLSSGQKIQLHTPVPQQQASPSGPNIQTRYIGNNVPIQSTVQQPQAVQVKVTGAILPTTVAGHNQKVTSPLRSPVLPSSYKPLESLQEVNRQTSQSTVVSPVSAVIPEADDSTQGSPTELRNQVTVSERYRYIAPSPQQSHTSLSVISPPASVAAVTGLGHRHVQTSTLKTSTPSILQALAPATSQVQVKQEPKPSLPVSPLNKRRLGSSPIPSVQISQVHSGAPAVAAAAAAPATFPVKVKLEKDESTQMKSVKRDLNEDNDVVEQPPVRKPRLDKEVIIIDSPSPTHEGEKFELGGECAAVLNDVDEDIILKLGKLNRHEQWIKLATSAQQLRNLRANVCKLLRVLVPEIELGDKTEILDDTTVDNLLKQVLEANLQSENTEM